MVEPFKNQEIYIQRSSVKYEIQSPTSSSSFCWWVEETFKLEVIQNYVKFLIKILYFQLQDIGALKFWKNAKPKLFSYPIDILGLKHLESFDKIKDQASKRIWLRHCWSTQKTHFRIIIAMAFVCKKYSLSKFPNYNSHDFCVQKYSLSEWLDKCRPHSHMASVGPELYCGIF